MSSEGSAGFPASGLTGMMDVPSLCWSLLHWTGLRLPDVGGVLRDGAVAGELAGVAHIEDRLAHPRVGLCVQGADLFLGLDVCRQVGEVPIVVAVREEHVPDRGKDPRLGLTEGVVTDHIQCGAGLGLTVVVPV